MTEWTATTVLPNIEPTEPVNGGLAALAPVDDLRVQEICQIQPDFRDFLNRFSDAFQEQVRPAVLIVKSDSPQSMFTVEAMASFRDAVALATVAYNRAIELRHRRGHRITYSDAFNFYPWMIDRHGEDVIAQTPALLGVHEVSSFRGQSSPEVLQHSFNCSDLDLILLKALLERWEKRYAGQNPVWRDIALFRSLNMANQAAHMPAGSDTTFYDVGRSLALWVSAFEILAHPGNGKSSLFRVYELLSRVEWQHKEMRSRRYKVHGINNKRQNMAYWLYGRIHKTRNDFLHGNPVSRKQLLVSESGRSLYEYAAPLYHIALTGFLPLAWTEAIPAVNDGKALGKYIAEKAEHLDYQKTVEQGLLTARGKAAPLPVSRR